MSDESERGPVLRGKQFPVGVEPMEEHVYSYPIGDGKVEDLGWKGYMKVAHEAGMVGRELEVIESGTYPGQDMMYAVVKVAVIIETDDGEHERYEAIQGADEASNQVGETEFLWSVAASRAYKRAIWNALNIYPEAGEYDPEKHRLDKQVQDQETRRRATGGPSTNPTSSSGGNVTKDAEGNTVVEPPPDHESQGPAVKETEGDDGFDFGE